jgi:hypothetical protein
MSTNAYFFFVGFGFAFWGALDPLLGLATRL